MRKNLANMITLLNLAFGATAIFFALNKEFFLSSIFILVAAVIDFLDGRIARLFNLESDIGAELDSLSDLVSFGVAPAIMAHQIFQNMLLAVFLLLFILAGAFRLARFNTLRKRIKGFVGMPITVNGILFPVLYYANANLIVMLAVVAISAILMVSTLRFGKL